MPLITRSEPANPVEQLRIWTSFAGGSRRLIVVARDEAYVQIHEHAAGALPNEAAGFLLGRAGFDAGSQTWHLTVERTMSIETTAADQNSFRFDWRAVAKVRELREAGRLALLGWYHSHPGQGIFLSEADVQKTHCLLFGEPFQVALVYDPVRNRAGYFYWDGPGVISTQGAEWREFQLLGRDGERHTDVETLVSRSLPATGS